MFRTYFEVGVPIGENEISFEQVEMLKSSKHCQSRVLDDRLYFFSKRSFFSFAVIKGIVTPVGQNKFRLVKKITVGLLAFELSILVLLITEASRTDVYNLALGVGVVIYLSLYVYKAFVDFRNLFIH